MSSVPRQRQRGNMKNSLREGVDAGLHPVRLDVAPSQPQGLQARVLGEEAAQPPQPLRPHWVVGEVESLDGVVAQQHPGQDLFCSSLGFPVRLASLVRLRLKSIARGSAILVGVRERCLFDIFLHQHVEGSCTGTTQTTIPEPDATISCVREGWHLCVCLTRTWTKRRRLRLASISNTTNRKKNNLRDRHCFTLARTYIFPHIPRNLYVYLVASKYTHKRSSK